MGGGGSRSQTTVQPDPEQQALARLLRTNVEQTLPLAGGLPGITAFRPLAIPTGAELGVLGRIFETASATPQPFEQLFQGAFQPTFDTLSGAVIPVAQQRFEQVVAPGIQNRLTAAGFAPGSGAVAEALARGGSELTLPLTQQAFQQAGNVAFQSASRRPEDILLERLPMALSALEAPRQALLGETSRRGDILLNLLSGFPTSGGASQTSQRQAEIGSLLGVPFGK